MSVFVRTPSSAASTAAVAASIAATEVTEVIVGSASYSVRVVTIAWALSSWTKAALLLRSTPPPFRFMSEDEKRYFAAYHLLIAWTSLRHMRSSTVGVRPNLFTLLVPSSPTKQPPSAAEMSLLTVLTVLFDEVAYHFLFLMMFGRKPMACGEPAKGAVDEDCMVCHGAGVDERVLAKLEYFCESPRHVAHRHCMNVWVSSRQRNAHQCPACRRPIRMRSDFSSLSLKDFVREISWSKILMRSLITATYVAALRFLGSLAGPTPRPPSTPPLAQAGLAATM